MVLEYAEKQNILDLMENYKKLHEQISRIEVTSKEMEKSLHLLHKEKDVVIKGIEDNRENESGIIKGLVEKYGEGRLDLQTFDWIPNEIKQ